MVGRNRADWQTCQCRKLLGELSRADLGVRDFDPASSLAQVNLSGAKLTAANLAGVNLTAANLSRADLTGADLSESRLSRAVLTDAKLDGVNFKGALMPDGSTHE